MFGGTATIRSGTGLQAVARAGLPLAIRTHDLAQRHPRALADHGYRLALLGELDPAHGKAALASVERTRSTRPDG